MRSYVLGLVSGLAVATVVAVAVTAAAKNHGMFSGGLDPRPYYANFTLDVGTTQEHQFIGDGTATHIEVKSIRKVRCEFAQMEVVGTKMTAKIVSTQEGAKCTHSYTSKGSEFLKLTCIGTTPNGPTENCQVEIQSD